MTRHISYEGHKCSKCFALFIPFRKESKCPKCEESTEEFFDFIPEVVKSMKCHKKIYGHYRPDAWFVGCISDHIQGIIFDIFDLLEYKKPEDSKEFIINFLNNIEWEDKYMHKYIKEIALAIYNIYKDDEEFKSIKINKEIESPGFFNKFFIP